MDGRLGFPPLEIASKSYFVRAAEIFQGDWGVFIRSYFPVWRPASEHATMDTVIHDRGVAGGKP